MSSKFKRTRSLGEVKTKSFEQIPYLKDLVEMVELGRDYKELRVVPNSVVTAGVHYLPLFNKDGEPVMSKWNKKEQAMKPVYCLAWDFDNARVDHNKDCPYCNARLDMREETYVEVLDREEVESEPAKHKPSKEEAKTGVKDKENSGSWTPIRVWRLTSSVVNKLQKLESLNKHKVDGERQAFGIDDAEYGCDIFASYDDGKDIPPTDRYNVQKGDATAFTEEEEGYLVWDVASVIAEKCTASEDSAKRDVERYLKFADGVESEADDDDEEEDGEYTPEKGDIVYVTTDDDEEYTGVVKKVTSKILTLETDDGDNVTISWADIETCEPAENDSDEDDEDDEDEPPVKSKKPAAKSKSKRYDDDDDDDDEPPMKSSKKGKKAVEDDEDDGDEDDEEDDEDERPMKSKGKSKPKYDFDEEDDEEDEDEKPAKRSKKKVVDEDDEDEEDEDEKPAKRSKKPAKKRKVDFDDDEDDDDF